jgi:uncharacterized protein
MIRTTIVAALSLCAVAPAFAQEAFDRPYWLDRRVIEALGRAEINVTADTARFEVTFREVDGNARDAMFAASDRARLAEAAIRSRGGDSVRISSSAEVEAIHEEYRNREGERMSSERADQVANYAVSVTLDVVIRDVTRAASVRAAAMAVGPEETSDISYSLDENAPDRLRAYRAAVQDAAARARAAAEASGATLGGLLVLQDGQGPCLGNWDTGVARRRDTEFNRTATGIVSGADEIVVTGARARELRLTAQEIARMQLPEDTPPIRLSAQVCAVFAVG